jgi:hypothetical protein
LKTPVFYCGNYSDDYGDEDFMEDYLLGEPYGNGESDVSDDKD